MTDRIDEIKAALAESTSQHESWTAGDDVVLWETADMIAHGRERLAWCVGEIERLRDAVQVLAQYSAMFDDGCADCRDRCVFGQDHADDCAIKRVLPTIEDVAG